ncbi:MAG: hypothetical protein DCC73_11990 [Proteobacteria bacterium]|nr:MAG: hypothetical protein DCC73_11990 [Pseudomonadota bacterium]
MGRVVLIEAWPRRPSDGATVPFRVIGGAPIRADYFGVQWLPALATLPRFETRLGFDGRVFGAGAVNSVGDISVALGSTALDAYLEYLWANAAVTIKEGNTDDADGAFVTTWTGRAATAKAANKRMIITLADPAEELRRPVLTSRYAGSGDLEGPADLKGELKYKGWGVCENVPTRLIDPAYNIWQANDGAVTFGAIRDGGVAFSSVSNVADLAALRAAVIAAGAVVTCNALGLIRPWTAPKYKLTADITVGSATTAADIAQAIVTARSTLTFASGTVAAFNALNSAAISVFIDDERTVAEALDQIFAGIGAWWKLNASGQIELGRWEFGGGAQTFEAEVADIARVDILAPTYRRQVGYRRNYAPLSDGEIAAAILSGDISDIGAFAPIALVNDAGCTITGNVVVATGATGAWGVAAVHSVNAYAGGVFVEFMPAQADKQFMVGLSVTPTTDNSYASINFAIFCAATGDLQVYEGGVQKYSSSTYVAGDVLAVTFDNVNVRYWKNGVVIYTSAQPPAVGAKLYLDSAFLSLNGKVTILGFGPYTANDVYGRPPSQVLLGLTEIHETFSRYASVSDIPWTFTGSGELSLVSSTDSGGKALRCGNNSGNDHVQGICNQWLDYSPEDLYMVSFDIEIEAVSSGVMYFGVKGEDVDGNNIISDAGTYHYQAGIAEVESSTGRFKYIGYIRGLAAAGGSTGYEAGAPDNPRPMKTGVVRIKPMFIVNYSAAAGQIKAHEVRLRKVVDATPLYRGNWSSATTYYINDAVDYQDRRFMALIKNTNVAPPASESSSATWLYIGKQPAEAGATRNDIYNQTSDPGAVANGSYWYSSSTKLLKRRESGAWVTVGNAFDNTNSLTDGANLGGTATWSGVSGTGKPEDYSTRNDIYNQTSDPGAVANGSYWYSSSTKLLKRRESGAWVTVGNAFDNTNSLTDGANLGGTATWSGVSGTGKPTDYATRNDFYNQTSDPGAVANGSYWYSSSTKLLKQRLSGAWVTAASYNTGALADKNTVGNADVDDDAISTPKVQDGAGAIVAAAYTSGSITTSSDSVWSVAQQVTVTDSTAEIISISFTFHAINLGGGWTKNSVRVRRNLGGVDTYVWGGSAGKPFIIDNDGMAVSGGCTDTVAAGDDPTYYVEFKKYTGYTGSTLSVSERHMVAIEDKFA